MMSASVLGLTVPVLMLWCAGLVMACPRREESRPPAVGRAAMIGLFALMLAVRLVFAGSVHGYQADLQTFQAWAVLAAEDLPGFYSGGSFADYPPGYIYVLYLIGKLKALLDLPHASNAFVVLIKMPAILADLAGTWLVYRVARAEGNLSPLACLLLYGFNPAVILNSAVWGQVDGVFTLFVALAVVGLAGNRPVLTGAAWALALLIKPQALIFSPLLICGLADRLWPTRRSGTAGAAVGGVLAAIALFAAGVAPFAREMGPWWFVGQYGRTLASYPYASLNAFNLFGLTGGNFQSESEVWLMFSYRTWGGLFVVAISLFAVILYTRSRGRAGVEPYLAVFLIAAVFVCSSKMHERYLFPVMMLSLLSALYTADRRLVLLFAGYSVSHFGNVAYVLAASLQGTYHIPRFDPLLLAVSLANLVLLALTVGYGLRRFAAHPQPVPLPYSACAGPSTDSGSGR